MRFYKGQTALSNLSGRKQESLGVLRAKPCHNICGEGLDTPVDEEAAQMSAVCNGGTGTEGIKPRIAGRHAANDPILALLIANV